MPPDLETPLRRGEPLGVLFDANVLLDVFLQRANAYPAARALTLAEADAVKGHVCASAFGVICHHGAASGPGRGGRERRLARDIMQFLDVLPLTEDVLTAALGYESLSFEDAHRELLRSIARGAPKWFLLEVRDVGVLPAVEWRMRKLAQLDERERSAMVRRVEAALTDKINSIHHRARYFVPSVRARASW